LSGNDIPLGVDPLKRELYLESKEFESKFEMTMEEYGKLKEWKQIKLKQKLKLLF